MITSLLHEQHIRRRRRIRSRRSTTHVLDEQTRLRLKPEIRARLGAITRFVALVAAVGMLTTGLVIMATQNGDETVVPDSVERAAIDLAPESGAVVESPLADAPSETQADVTNGSASTIFLSDPVEIPLPQVEFERNEDMDYIVAPGDTLSDIAHKFDLDSDVLADYNDLANPNALVPGQRLLIPGLDLLSDLY